MTNRAGSAPQMNLRIALFASFIADQTELVLNLVRVISGLQLMKTILWSQNRPNEQRLSRRIVITGTNQFANDPSIQAHSLQS
jgi:hypothetical protein